MEIRIDAYGNGQAHQIGGLDCQHASTGKGRPGGFNHWIRMLMLAGF